MGNDLLDNDLDNDLHNDLPHIDLDTTTFNAIG